MHHRLQGSYHVDDDEQWLYSRRAGATTRQEMMTTATELILRLTAVTRRRYYVTALFSLALSFITALQKLLHVCEWVLQNLDFLGLTKRSVCMRIDPRYNMSCCALCFKKVHP